MGNIAVEKTGKTVEDAVNLALDELNVTEDKVEVEVLEEPTKSLFGLRTTDAKVRVTIIDYSADIARDFLSDILNKMGIEAKIEIEELENSLNINIESNKGGIIIGKRGETLDAIQFITSLVVNRNNEIYKKVIIDTENYRAKREVTLENLAKKLAKKVQRTRRSLSLEPMNPYERRIIHSTLQQYDNVETYSVGEEPNRRVIIKNAR